MRYEDWTHRETEIHLREQGELRGALGIDRVPDDTTLYRFLRRLNEEDLTPLLGAAIRRMPPPPAEKTAVAVDTTGPTPGAISTFFVNRVRDRVRRLTWRHWLKWIVVADLQRRHMLAEVARPSPCNDEALLPALLQHACQFTPIQCAVADAEFDSERNHRYIRQELGAKRYPRQVGQSNLTSSWHPRPDADGFPGRPLSLACRCGGVRFHNQAQALPTAPGRSPAMQQRQTLLLGVTYTPNRHGMPSFYAFRMSTGLQHL